MGFYFHFQDLGSSVCPRTGEMCNGRIYQRLATLDHGPQWYRPLSLKDVSAIFAANQFKQIKFVVGDTGKGELSYIICMQ